MKISKTDYPDFSHRLNKILEETRKASEYFGGVIFTLPEHPSFPAAVKWCWSQPTDEFFFNLEDDWELTTKVNINSLLNILKAEPNLSCITIRAYGFLRSDNRICLSPSLMRTDHAKTIAGRMTTLANPEKQLRPRDSSNMYGDAHRGFFGRQYPSNRTITMCVDIGRPWLESYNLVRPDNFVSWSSQNQ